MYLEYTEVDTMPGHLFMEDFDYILGFRPPLHINLNNRTAYRKGDTRLRSRKKEHGMFDRFHAPKYINLSFYNVSSTQLTRCQFLQNLLMSLELPAMGLNRFLQRGNIV